MDVAQAARGAGYLRAERIRRIIDGDRLTVLFQPIAELATGRVVGLEALARFAVAPKRGPREWFAEAKAVGLLTALELAATRRALGEFRYAPPDTYLALNVSSQTAADGALLDLLDGQAPRVVLELPGRELAESSIEYLAAAREHGVRVAVDGTAPEGPRGGWLARLRPDIVKLGFDVTHHVDVDEARRARAAEVVAVASDLGAAVVAVGIERRPELEALVAVGVPLGQGFLLALPGYLPLGPPGEPAVLRV